MNSRNKQTYIGIHNDRHGGMTLTGGMIKDAWIFGLIPETETCEGWTAGMMQSLHDQVSAEWDKYGLRVGNLPPDIRERHERIHRQAMEKARAMGWNPDQDTADDS